MDNNDADKLTHQIAADWTQADLEEKNRALCRFAEALSKHPESMKEDHILELRQVGFSDSAIHDTSQVVSYFNYINRIADSLSVDLEHDIHAWEQSIPE